MERLRGFEHHRYVGDKRTQRVHDIDHAVDEPAIADMVAAESYLGFGPDTLPEARNRGYRLCRSCRRARVAAGVDDGDT
ncbi:MAG TPA: hypothetical protein VFQ49_01555 [Actinomycetes bacterium]|nr:hypothetical protein [Acidimicrobiales bacterium]HET9289737.1 hypothetical protein [Actinomycetes bacterium]